MKNTFRTFPQNLNKRHKFCGQRNSNWRSQDALWSRNVAAVLQPAVDHFFQADHGRPGADLLPKRSLEAAKQLEKLPRVHRGEPVSRREQEVGEDRRRDAFFRFWKLRQAAEGRVKRHERFDISLSSDLVLGKKKKAKQCSDYKWLSTPDHLMLNSAPNLGPLMSRWEINKFENC
jgi:hypothetical protein